MGRTFREALLEQMTKRGIGLAELARKSGVSHEQLKKLKQRPTGSTNVEDAQRLARALGLSIDELIEDNRPDHDETIAVVGYVGAGARVPLADPYEKGGGLYYIMRPPQLPRNGFVAVEVEGSSMEPAYESGDVLFYSRQTLGVPSDAVGRRCVCEDAEGNVWVKLVKHRDDQPRSSFDLLSFHEYSPPMYDVNLKWASPITMHLPKDLVTITEPN